MNTKNKEANVFHNNDSDVLLFVYLWPLIRDVPTLDPNDSSITT
jgi:hypothetical protein